MVEQLAIELDCAASGPFEAASFLLSIQILCLFAFRAIINLNSFSKTRYCLLSNARDSFETISTSNKDHFMQDAPVQGIPVAPMTTPRRLGAPRIPHRR